MADTQKVSFTVRRPSPVSRGVSSGPDSDSNSTFKIPSLPRHLRNDLSNSGSPLARSGANSPQYEPDSSDEDEELQDELVSGFDKFGVERCVQSKSSAIAVISTHKALGRRFNFECSVNKPKKKQEGPLVIPALKNRDWRDVARKRRGQDIYVPPSAAARTGADGSVAGLGTMDTINSGPQLSGLQVRRREMTSAEVINVEEGGDVPMAEPEAEETEDERALRAILAEAGGRGNGAVDIIPIAPVSEADAYKQDVDELPDPASLDDYQRVPVSQFGAALLRGMGWKEGQAASRKIGKGLVEPYLPAARPALLGIGAKEQEIYDDGSGKKGPRRPEKRYVPVVKKDNGTGSGDREKRSRSSSPRRDDRSLVSSRRGSKSPGRKRDRDDRRGDDDRNERKKDKHRDGGQGRDRDFRRDRERDYERSKNRDSARDRERERDRVRDRDRDHPQRKDRSPDSSSRRRRDY